MKISILALILLMILLGMNDLRAQSICTYFREVDFGFGAEQLQLASSDSSESAIGFGTLLGWNFPLIHPDENMAIGLNPSFDFLFVNFEEGSAAVLQFPVFLTVKLGTDAQYYNQSTYGATAGIGYRFGVVTNNNVDFGALNAMIEGSMIAGHLILKLRYTTQLTDKEITSGLTMFHSGLYLIVTGKL